MLVRLLSLGLLLGLAACTETTNQQATTAPPAAAPAAPAATAPVGVRTTPYAGEYNWGDAKRKQAGGTLTVYPESDSTVLV